MDGRTVLLDCGEGTQHQLLRTPIRFIEAICITHMHGDHVYGLPGLLASFSMNGRTAPLALYGPPELQPFLDSVISLSYLKLQYELLFPGAAGGPPAARTGAPRRARSLGGYSIETAPLLHRVPATGYCIVEDDRRGTFDVDRARALGVPEGPLFRQLQMGSDVMIDGRLVRSADIVGPPRRGRRIAYCTDTRPSPTAVALARGADILIHEATYTSDMAAEAEERGHSTAAEAATVARDAGVKQLILTHFSPRYTDVAPLLAEARAIFPNTSAAFDFAEVGV
jgi:ribonuclease Z